MNKEKKRFELLFVGLRKMLGMVDLIGKRQKNEVIENGKIFLVKIRK